MTNAEIKTPVADTYTYVVTDEISAAANVYNAQGQRVQKAEDGRIMKYFYSNGAQFYTVDGNGTLNTENILDLSGQIIASMRFEDMAPS